MGDLAGALIVIAILGFIALLIKWTGMGKYAELQRLFETQKQIIDKIGSGPEVIQFIESKEGKEFFERLKTPPTLPPTQKPNEKRSPEYYLGIVTFTMWLGIIAAGGGVGGLVAAHFYPDPDFFGPGCIFAGIGIGMLIVAWITYLLFKKWGMIYVETAKKPGSQAL
jgi:hypothetical protein